MPGPCPVGPQLEVVLDADGGLAGPVDAPCGLGSLGGSGMGVLLPALHPARHLVLCPGEVGGVVRNVSGGGWAKTYEALLVSISRCQTYQVEGEGGA